MIILVFISSKEAWSFDSPLRGRFSFFSGDSFASFGGGHEKPSRRELKKQKKRKEYQLRKKLWLQRYGTFEALERTFGVAPPLGDLSPEQTRRLYHTLLPRSLLGLYEMGVMKPEELAPLAYNARIAAKEYARSRCVWTGRLMTAAFDIYRGRLGKSSSMSWEELYKKYEAQIVEEECSDELNGTPDDEDLTMRIYLRILERSCSTNQAFDALFLNEEDDDDESGYLDSIAKKLEEDVCFLLLPSKKKTKAAKLERKLQKAEARMEKKRSKHDEKELRKRQKSIRKRLRQKRRLKASEAPNHDSRVEAETVSAEKSADSAKASSKRWKILRILAGARLKDKKLRKEKS